MFDLGMMELLVIGVTALIVVGPKDLPVMFRTVGQFMGRMRGMARDFQRAMNDAADETGMRGLDRDIRKMTSASKLGLGDVKEAARSMADVEMEPKARGPSTTRLAEERAASAARVREAAAERAAARAAEGSPKPKPAPEPAPEPAAKGEAEAS